MEQDPTAQKILKRVRGKGKGWVFSPKDLLDINNRNSIDVALHHLCNDNILIRLDRGIYYYPKTHPKLGTLSPDPLQIAQAIARQKAISPFLTARRL